MRRKQSVNLWHIIEDNFDPKKMNSQGSVYTIGNGYFATRGTFEENYFGAKLYSMAFSMILTSVKKSLPMPLTGYRSNSLSMVSAST